MAIVKCRNCGKQIERDLAIVISNRRYVCSNECKNELENKAKPNSNQSEERKELISYLTKLSVGKINYPKETALLKKMLKENPNFSISGIKYTIWYLVKIEKKKINGFGLVPYYYEKAAKYYFNLQKAKKKIKEAKFKQDEEIVIVKTNKYIEEDIFD